MSDSAHPVTRRSLIKALAAAPIAASPLTARPAGRGEPAGPPVHANPADSSLHAPAVAHETLIGVL